jgi:hypothetical protein
MKLPYRIDLTTGEQDDHLSAIANGLVCDKCITADRRQEGASLGSMWNNYVWSVGHFIAICRRCLSGVRRRMMPPCPGPRRWLLRRSDQVTP